MKSLSTISAIVILATAISACSKHKSSIRENADGSIKTENESVVATKAEFADSLTSGSWVSACDKEQKRVRLEFDKSSSRMITYDESCSRGEKNSEVEGSLLVYKLTNFDAEENSMHLQLLEYIPPVESLNRPTSDTGKSVQAFQVSLDGDKLSLVGLLTDDKESPWYDFPMQYSRVPQTTEALLF